MYVYKYFFILRTMYFITFCIANLMSGSLSAASLPERNVHK